MKKTKSFLEVLETPTGVNLKFDFNLVREDWVLFQLARAYLEEHIQEERDEGDFMLDLITWAIHRLTEERTGEPFVLRMDRPKN